MKTFLIALVTLAGVTLATPQAEARDRDHHQSRRDYSRHHHHHDRHHNHYRSYGSYPRSYGYRGYYGAPRYYSNSRPRYYYRDDGYYRSRRPVVSLHFGL